MAASRIGAHALAHNIAKVQNFAKQKFFLILEKDEKLYIIPYK